MATRLTLSSRARLSLISVGPMALSFALACSPGSDDLGAELDAGSGGDGLVSSGGALTAGSGGSGGSAVGAGGALAGTGGAAPAPVDCAPLSAAGYELCDSSAGTCGAVFTDSAGCTAVCAAAGLGCEAAYENVDGACAADESLPALPCDSGHQNDYCRCTGPQSGSGGSGSGGAAGSGGASGSGGAEATGGSTGTGSTSGAPDCNTIGNQPSIDVSKDGLGDFMTVQAAVNSLAKSNTTPTIIRIAPGTYKEKLILDRPHITLCGQAGKTSSTILTYSDGSDASNGNGGTVGTSGSASVNLSASNVSAENLTFANSRGVGAQAVALLVTGSQVQFRDCRFIGNQDTLYTKGGSQYFKDCYVEGTVDFIFGGATAVFDQCSIHNVGGGTAVVAPSTDQAVPYGIVFLGGTLTAASGVSNGSMALARNWGAYGAAAFIKTVLGAHIKGVGWVPMGENTLATARFSEYQSTGAGANAGARAPQSKQLSSGEASAYTVDNIFGSWNPTYSE